MLIKYYFQAKNFKINKFETKNIILVRKFELNISGSPKKSVIYVINDGLTDLIMKKIDFTIMTS